MTSDEAAGGTDLWRGAYQVAVVVKDMDSAVEFYEGLGIGPFTEGPSAHTVERRIYGSLRDDIRLEGRLASMGNIELELLQPVAGPSIQAEFLQQHGEGVVHICAYTDDLTRDIEDMKGRGAQVISYGRLEDGGQFAYFDTRAVGGLILELFEPGPDWR